MNIIKKKESQFTQVSNIFLRDNRISFKAKGLFCYMFSMADGWNFTMQSIANQQKDGVASVSSAMDELKEYGYVVYEKHSDGKGTYHLDDEPKSENPNVENPNMGFTIMGKSECIKNKQSSKNKDLSEYQDNIVEIVSHLNDILNKDYKPTTSSTRKLIQARLKDGFTLQDFQKVHIVKFAEWNGTDMQKYLRPETLYGSKFESYLNQELSDYDKAKAICKIKGITMQELMQQGGVI